MQGSVAVGHPVQKSRIAYAILALLLLVPPCLLSVSQARAESQLPGIVYSVPVMITNTQAEATSGSFTQMITVDFTKYASYAAPNLQNVEFFTPNGNVIPSWLESGNTTSTDAIFWLHLGSINPGSGQIFMGFVSQSTSLFGQGGPVGEAPELSTHYGEYDNGVSIFPFYDNFRGNTLSSNWVNNSAVSRNPVSVNNGLVIGQTSNESNIPAVYSKNSFTVPGTLEFYTTIHTSSSSYGLGVGLMSSSNPVNNSILVGSGRGPARGLWTTSNGTVQCMSSPQVALDFNTPYVYSISVSQTPPSTVTFTVDYNYSSAMSTSRDVPTVPLSIGFLNGRNSPGVLGPTYWVRIRAYPPNGVMPTVSFSSSSSSTSSSSFPSSSSSTSFSSFVSSSSSSFDFYINFSQRSVNAQPGGNVSQDFSVVYQGPSSYPISLSATGLPPWVTVSFNPSTCTPFCISTMTISVSPSAPKGTYPVTITGNGGGITHSITFGLNVGGTSTFTTPTSTQTQFGFSLSCQPPSLNFSLSTQCTAVVANSNGNVPTGVVSWFSKPPGSFSPAECTLSGGICAVSYTPSSAGSVFIMASYSGDSHYPQSSANFMLNVISSTGSITSGTQTTATMSTATTATPATAATRSPMTLPSLPSLGIDPLVALAVLIAMIVVAAVASVNWLRRKGDVPSKPAQAQTESGGSASQGGGS
jgi:hypothetical protein